MTIAAIHAETVRPTKARQASTPKSRKPRKTLAERHAAMVDKSAGLFDCWTWTGSIATDGYGKIGVIIEGKKRTIPAHILAWRIDNAMTEVPSGKHVLHRCNNPKCCNPSHLRIGTHAENMRQCVEDGRHRHRISASTLTTIVDLGIFNGMKPGEIAKRLGINPSTARNTLNGRANSKLTGIPRNQATGKGRDIEPLKAAVMAFRAAQDAKVVDLAEHRRSKRFTEYQPSAA